MNTLMSLMIEPSDTWFEADIEAVLPPDSEDPWVASVVRELKGLDCAHTTVIALPPHPVNVAFYKTTLLGILEAISELGVPYRLRWWTVRRDGRLVLAVIRRDAGSKDP